MKRYILFAVCILSLPACKNTWDSETKDMFQQSCMEEATRWAGSETKAKTYCDCVLEKTMKKYPDYKDALEHIDSVIIDPDIQGCKSIIQ